MTEKEKAIELVRKFRHSHTVGKIFTADFNHAREKRLDDDAKQCALIAVYEIISACEYNNVESWNTNWWYKVKAEISNL